MSESMQPGGYPPVGQPQPGVPPQQPGVPLQQPASSGGGKPLLFGGIGVVVGLLVGVLAGSTLLGGGGGSGTGGAADDAATACAYVEASVDQVSDETMALDQPLIWQLQAAGALAEAAATGEESYEAFGEQGMELFRAVSMLDVDLAQETLTAMEQTCQDL